MSLRARLLVGLLGLASIGLLVAAVATWTLLDDFLTDRLDQQLLSSATVASNVVEAQVVAADVGPGPVGGDPAGQRPPGRFGAGVPNPRLPLGLVGLHAEIRSPDGTVLGSTAFAPGADGVEPPALPADLAVPPAGETVLRSVDTDDGSAYRVLTEQMRSGDLLVVAAPLSEVEGTLSRLVTVEIIVTLGVLTGLAAMAWFVVQSGVKPLVRMESTAEAIAAGDLSQRVPVEHPRTEVGRLGTTFNTMVDRIETSFEQQAASEARLRRFLSDASHELRTPLTSIRGYAELFRRGAASRPGDLELSMRRIEDEATRMGVIVDDLLLLARLDQGPSTGREPVALDRLVADAVTDARVVGRDHTFETDLTPLTVLGDDARLRQVATNLLANAVAHTPAGTTVGVRVAPEGSVAVLEVADDGPGMTAEDAARVFDRFTRVDQGRTRDKGGSGLGLAIVAAIADTHGGTVRLKTAPGVGSTFRVELPLVSA
jgi:two-component system OmpR family sensor kinase